MIRIGARRVNNFTRNEVWELVKRPNQNVIGTKWVFRNKQDEHGVVTRNKGRLAAWVKIARGSVRVFIAETTNG